LTNIYCKALSEYVLLDWDNVANAKGENVPYSQEAAMQVLKSNEEFRDFVADIAGNQAMYETEFKEATAKK